jgi:hypothetical protein
MKTCLFEEVPGLYRIIALQPFRRTEGVFFDIVPMAALPRIDGIDRVIHASDALSPGSVVGVERPWYVHPHQEDNLIVLAGRRTVDVWSKASGQMQTFVVEPQRIARDGQVVFDGPAMLVWPCNVFHRIVSGAEGSASLNFAVRHEGFDIKTNFSIYDLDLSTGESRVIRPGHMDQMTS